MRWPAGKTHVAMRTAPLARACQHSLRGLSCRVHCYDPKGPMGTDTAGGMQDGVTLQTAARGILTGCAQQWRTFAGQSSLQPAAWANIPWLAGWQPASLRDDQDPYPFALASGNTCQPTDPAAYMCPALTLCCALRRVCNMGGRGVADVRHCSRRLARCEPPAAISHISETPLTHVSNSTV